MTLIEKIETAEEGSAALDAEITRLLYREAGAELPDDAEVTVVWEYTRSIDAAMSLVESDWEWALDNDTGGDCAPFRFKMGWAIEAEGNTPALAICAAALRARGEV